MSLDVCQTCTALKPVPQCTTTLQLGTISSLSTAIYIFIQNLSTGYVYRQSAITTGAGGVELDMMLPSGEFYNPNSSYNVWVTLQSGDPNERQDITVDGVLYEDVCFQMPVCLIRDANGDPVTYTTVAVEVDS